MTAQPKEDGATLELRAKPRPATRLNRRVIAFLLILIGLVVLVAFAWGLRKPKGKATDGPPEIHETDRVARAEGLASLPKDYSGVPKLGAPTGEFGHPILKAEKEAGLPHLPEKPDFRPNPEEEALRAQRLKEQHEAEEAAKGAVVVSLSGKFKGSRPAATAESAALRAPGADLLGALNALPSREKPEENDDASQSAKRAFVNEATDTKIYGSGKLQTPRSPYQLMAGSVISAALVTGIQSDLPGQVIATVTENIFDSVSGQTLLIPQGARLLGQYDSQVAWGQSRVLLVWTRLIMPDGSSVILDRLPGTDTSGNAGLKDEVNWHWGQIFAGAAVSTLLGAAAELAAPDRSDGRGDVIVAGREGLQDTVNQVGQELTRRNLKVQPTLTERPGLPLKVIVNKDLVLRPYERSTP
jgi:type IV secretory pathway VirB10-like protein